MPGIGNLLLRTINRSVVLIAYLVSIVRRRFLFEIRGYPRARSNWKGINMADYFGEQSQYV
ncbi:hypothetical protein C8R31_105120 [Nitrosospira sp. Nsp2]|nr:hypothetical protein C8R31_105120 [Nitrosospira sp. Nsp2]